MDPLNRVIALALITFASMGAPPQQGDWKHLSAVDAAACKARGGFVERMGMAGAEGCLIYYEDAGKVCADKADCQGMCLYQGDPAHIPNPPKGLCAPSSSPFGCYTRIDKGQIVGLCVD